MKTLIVEPYFTGSHKHWIDGLVEHSKHDLSVISLRGKYWKWRMSGGAISLVNQLVELKFKPDLILCTDMLDLALFKSLLPSNCSNIPIWIYFHENQLTYPFQDKKTEDRHYGFINYTSALVADKVIFNSDYHRQSFLSALENFLKVLPDERNLQNVEKIRTKSLVLHLGLNLPQPNIRTKNEIPVFLWNHRWEYDKNPELFFTTLIQLKALGYSFRINVVGESFAGFPIIFNQAKELLSDHIDHWGYVESKKKYIEIIQKSNLLFVTSKQDFFGISVVEAIASGCFPLLPSRLAFPEVVPFDAYFYSNDDTLLDQLKNILDLKIYLESTTHLMDFVSRYNWKNCIEKYDILFDEIN